MDRVTEEARASQSSAAVALDRLLSQRPAPLVAALGGDGRLTRLPSSLRVDGQQIFDRASGIDLLIASDQPVILEAWHRAQSEPVVEVEVHLLADPERSARLFFIDVRAEHDVHAVVLHAADPALVVRSIELVDRQRRLTGNVRRDAIGTFLEIDAAASAILGWSASELVGRRTMDLVHPDDVDRAVDGWMAMRSGTPNDRIQVRFRHATGRYVWLEVANEDRLDDPDQGCVLSQLVDISDQMAALEAMHDRERFLHRLAEALPIGICHLRPDHEVVYSNAPWVELLGPIDSVESLVGAVSHDDRQGLQRAIDHAFGGRSRIAIEVGVPRTGEERRCDLTFRTMVGDEDGLDGVIVCAADVTDRSRMRSELEHRASHDALSGCLNRAATVQVLEQALRSSEHVTIAYIDLDGFKQVNDELGHAAGDEVLRVVAARLRSVIRAEDRLGRIGGDEFVVICPQDGEPFGADALTDRLAAALRGEVTFAEQRIALQASIGAVVSEDGELDAEILFGRADAAMYDSKRLRRVS
jgi:diguanylate cyclase (GGDEF)-like protein/PAS domain S-box-containing protein